ncbi:MAG: hypothetical protein WBU92_10810 [Candidatus Dormiibacterota bacterium]
MSRADLWLSGLDAGVARKAESKLASLGSPGVSSRRLHLLDPYVPLLIPEVNSEHLVALRGQRRWPGAWCIVTDPNCSTMGLALLLTPLGERFGADAVQVGTIQAVSRVGTDVVSASLIRDNVVPGEGDQLELAPRKILGPRGGRFRFRRSLG